MSDEEFFCPEKPGDFYNWLKKNHLKKTKISIIRYKKHTEKNSPSHAELMKEAICFGWIDTTIKRIDDDKYKIRFVRRNEKSRWSNNTLRYGKEMIEAGKMSPFGKKMYLLGKKKGVIDHGIPKDVEPPRDLVKELKENKKAFEFFESLSPSARRVHIVWVMTCKLEETRKRRIKKIVESFKRGKKIY